jgi:hypothetical protein
MQDSCAHNHMRVTRRIPYELEDVPATPILADLIDSTFKPRCLGETLLSSSVFLY